jgi:CBS domain-containing protein
VSDLIGGRAAWTALGLPTEGQIGDRRRVSQYVLPAPHIGVDATIADATAVAVDGRPVAVVSADGVLVGSIDAVALGLPGGTRVDEVMVTAPGTIRPELRVDEALQQLRDDGLEHVYVTAVSGVLVGLIVQGQVHV